MMTSNGRQRDLDDTDVYDVAMLPAAPAPLLEPRMPVAPAPLVTPSAPTAPVDRGSVANARSAQPRVELPPADGPNGAGGAVERPGFAPPAVPGWPAGWRPPYDTSGLAILAATILLVLGIIGAIAFAFALALLDALGRVNLGFGRLPLESIESTRIVIITLLLVSLVQIVSSIGVFAHRAWGRLLGLAISVPGTVLGTLVAIAASTRGLDLQATLAGLLLAAYGITFFGLIAGNSHFRRLARRY